MIRLPLVGLKAAIFTLPCWFASSLNAAIYCGLFGPEAGSIDALKACINSANLAGGGTIDLGGATYTLTQADNLLSDGSSNGLPAISSDITIENGTITTTINTPGFVGTPFRIFYVSGPTSFIPTSPSSLSLIKVTLANGVENTCQGGGAIFVSSGALIGVIKDSTFSDNQTVCNLDHKFALGGALYIDYQSSFETIENSTFINNEATTTSTSTQNLGGAIYSDGTGNLIKDSVFSSNIATGGGAIFLDSDGTIWNIVRSQFLLNQGVVPVDGGFGGAGGAILVNSGATISTIDETTFSLNVTTFQGGAIALFSNIGTISNTAFNANSTLAPAASEPLGGAIYLSPGSSIQTMYNDTINQNSAFAGGPFF